MFIALSPNPMLYETKGNYVFLLVSYKSLWL